MCKHPDKAFPDKAFIYAKQPPTTYCFLHIEHCVQVFSVKLHSPQINLPALGSILTEILRSHIAFQQTKGIQYVCGTHQYTQDTGTHCGVEQAVSMASSTPFTLSSTSLFTKITSKKCLYVDKIASDSFWIICRDSV